MTFVSRYHNAVLMGSVCWLLMLGSEPLRAQTASPTTVTAPMTDPYARFIYPLRKPIPAPPIKIDVSDAPDTLAWANQAQAVAAQWWPIVCQYLATDHFKPPKTMTLVFKHQLDAPAETSNAEISVSAPWIREHPNDFGMIIHEMTHVIQAYPANPGDPGWLVEGIADYIRYWRYEPDLPRPHIDVATASYHDGYGTTASFLAWLDIHYDRHIIFRLDEALRSGQYSDTIFTQVTGKSLDALWAEFLTVQPTNQVK